MIIRTFECAKGHITEPYVNPNDDLEKMKKLGKLLCMDCGSRIETIHPPTTRINSGVSRQSAQQQNTPPPEQMRAALVELRRQVEQNCDYVGERFAEEARKIHYGEVSPRGIYGEAEEKEVTELAEEGISVRKVPWIKPEN